MKAAVYRIPGRTHEDQLRAMAEGLERHSVSVDFFRDLPAADADFAVVWSWRVGLRVRQYFSRPILVMERGYIDRFIYTSLGWDGLNGRARFALDDDPSRFRRLFSDRLAPWRSGSKGYALLIGQVVGDTALNGVDIHRWYRETCVALYRLGWDIAFRQHPVEQERGIRLPTIPFASVHQGTLEEALAGAGLVVTYNSNTAVDAILAGVPVHAADEGSMVYDLASHDFGIEKPERWRRLAEIANVQWSLFELRDGIAWERAREAMLP